MKIKINNSPSRNRNHNRRSYSRYATTASFTVIFHNICLQVVNSGGTAIINCTWAGWPAPRLEWLHNGIPISGVTGGRHRVQSNGEQLVIASVHRSDKGVYQCVARNERDSAQASAEIRLGGKLEILKCSNY